jgi:hypothetical protein
MAAGIVPWTAQEAMHRMDEKLFIDMNESKIFNVFY